MVLYICTRYKLSGPKITRIRTTFQCHLHVIFEFKMIADKMTIFFGLMISIYEISRVTQKVLLEFSPNFLIEKVLVP